MNDDAFISFDLSNRIDMVWIPQQTMFERLGMDVLGKMIEWFPNGCDDMRTDFYTPHVQEMIHTIVASLLSIPKSEAKRNGCTVGLVAAGPMGQSFVFSLSETMTTCASTEAIQNGYVIRYDYLICAITCHT